jgi:uncharacterized sporulation protein YeaH/YhbH (DUF444 family)
MPHWTTPSGLTRLYTAALPPDTRRGGQTSRDLTLRNLAAKPIRARWSGKTGRNSTSQSGKTLPIKTSRDLAERHSRTMLYKAA